MKNILFILLINFGMIVELNFGSGTTFFFMVEGVDTGDVLDQKEFEILKILYG